MGLHELHPALSRPHPPHDFPVVFALLLGRSMCLSLSPFHPTSNYSPSSHSLIHSLTARSHVSDCMCPTQHSNIFSKCVETRVTTSFKWGWLNGVGGQLKRICLHILLDSYWGKISEAVDNIFSLYQCVFSKILFPLWFGLFQTGL